MSPNSSCFWLLFFGRIRKVLSATKYCGHLSEITVLFCTWPCKHNIHTISSLTSFSHYSSFFEDGHYPLHCCTCVQICDPAYNRFSDTGDIWFFHLYIGKLRIRNYLHYSRTIKWRLFLKPWGVTESGLNWIYKVCFSHSSFRIIPIRTAVQCHILSFSFFFLRFYF